MIVLAQHRLGGGHFPAAGRDRGDDKIGDLDRAVGGPVRAGMRIDDQWASPPRDRPRLERLRDRIGIETCRTQVGV